MKVSANTHTHTHPGNTVTDCGFTHKRERIHNPAEQLSDYTNYFSRFESRLEISGPRDVTALSVPAERLISYLDPNLQSIPSDEGCFISCCV